MARGILDGLSHGVCTDKDSLLAARHIHSCWASPAAVSIPTIGGTAAYLSRGTRYAHERVRELERRGLVYLLPGAHRVCEIQIYWLADPKYGQNPTQKQLQEGNPRLPDTVQAILNCQ